MAPGAPVEDGASAGGVAESEGDVTDGAVKSGISLVPDLVLITEDGVGTTSVSETGGTGLSMT